MKNLNSLRIDTGNFSFHFIAVVFCLQGTCEVMKELKAAKARKSGQSYIRPDPVTDIFLPELGMGACMFFISVFFNCQIDNRHLPS